MRLRVGYRTVEVRQGRLLVNGQAVTLRGVKRHEHDSKNDHVIGRDTMLEDIRLMKTHNFNAVRCSHYPNDELWYDLCDEHGLYVADEANIESHGIDFVWHKTLGNRPLTRSSKNKTETSLTRPSSLTTRRVPDRSQSEGRAVRV